MVASAGHLVGRVTACPEQSRMGARRRSACLQNKMCNSNGVQRTARPTSTRRKSVSVMLAGLKVKRPVKAAAGEVVGGKISANFLRVSIAYIIVYSCMQRFTVADRW